MKAQLFHFFALSDSPTGPMRYETVIPADTYSEALQTLAKNAAATTEIPVECWWLKSSSPQT